MIQTNVVAVMGATGAGKSTLVKSVTGNHSIVVGHSMKSETSSISEYIVTIRGRKITLVDTPGFDDTYLSDSEVLKTLSEWLERKYRVGVKLCGILYLHRITDTRMKGSSLRNLKMFKALCGEDFYKKITFGTTCWSLVDEQTGESREEELRTNSSFLKPMLRRQSKLVRISDNVDEAKDIIYSMSSVAGDALQVQREMVDLGRSFDNLSVTKTLNVELESLRKEQEAERQRVEEEQERLLRERQAEFERSKRALAKQARVDMYAEKQQKYCLNIKPFGTCDRCGTTIRGYLVAYRESPVAGAEARAKSSKIAVPV